MRGRSPPDPPSGGKARVTEIPEGGFAPHDTISKNLPFRGKFFEMIKTAPPPSDRIAEGGNDGGRGSGDPSEEIRRGLWPTACRAYVYVLPTLRFYGHFLWVLASTQKVAGFAANADFGGPNLATGRCTDGEKSKNELQASYRPKNLTIESEKPRGTRI